MTPGSKKAKTATLNREIIVFAFFLLLSFIFWYLNELSKELETTISYPVRYINPPKERILTGDLPRKLTMGLRGPGYSILKIKLSGSKAPAVIDLSKVSPKRIPGKTPHYYLVTSSMIQDFGRQLHADFEIVSIEPDTLFFSYDRIVTRRMPVIPDMKSETSPTNKVIVVSEPDSVSVTGPAHVLDTVSGIRTKRRSFKRMEENFNTSVPLVCPEYLEIDQKRVMLEVTVIDRRVPFFNLRYQKGSK